MSGSRHTDPSADGPIYGPSWDGARPTGWPRDAWRDWCRQRDLVVAALGPVAAQRGPILVAVSGGADSVTLLRLLADGLAGSGAGPLIIGHVRHRWHDRDADAVAVARQHAANLGIACTIAELETPADPAPRPSAGPEGSAREGRYRALARIAAQHEATTIVTAHTQTDQAETVLMRAARGTGLAGLAGIPPRGPIPYAPAGDSVARPMLVRPMLGLRRDEVRQTADRFLLAYVDDPTNDDPAAALRNRIRHRVMPILAAEIDPAAPEQLAALAEDARGWQGVLAPIVAEWADRVWVPAEDARILGRVRASSLTDAPPVLQRAVWQTILIDRLADGALPPRAVTRRILHAITNLPPTPSATVDLPAGLAVVREPSGDWQVIRVQSESNPPA